MNKQEQAYVTKVKDVVNSSLAFGEMVQQLVSIPAPEAGEMSVNATVLEWYIKELEFDLEEETLEDSESKVRKKLQQILSDIENGNWYRELFTAELAYSRLENGTYSYKIKKERIDASNLKAAQARAVSLKAKTPKSHPQATEFMLEDVRLRMELIDSHGSPAPIQFSNQDLFPL